MPFPSLAAGSGAALVLALAGAPMQAASPWGDLPIPGGAPALAAAAGLDPRHPAWAVPADLGARLYAPYDPRAHARDRQRLAAYLQRLPAAAPGDDVAPLPLGERSWREVILDPRDRATPLVAAILGDPRAARMYRGLLALDEPTLAFVEGRPALVRLLREHADTMSVLADGFRIREGRVEVPGGRAAEAGWEHLAEAAPADPEAFLEALLTRRGSRLMALHHALAGLAPDEQEAVLAPSGGAASVRAALVILADALEAGPVWWRDTSTRQGRPDVDLVAALDVVSRPSRGVVIHDRAFWTGVLPAVASTSAEAPILAAVAATIVRAPSPAEARTRLHAVALARRLAARAGGPRVAIAAAARAAAGHPALAIALERAGLDDPGAFAAAAVAAGRVAGPGDAEPRIALQGALAVVLAARRNGWLDEAAAGQAIGELARAAEARRPVSALAAALDGPVRRLLRPRGLDEALAARAADEAAAELEWEGLRYRVDFAVVERQRVAAWRAALPECALEEAVAAARARAAEERMARTLAACAYVAQAPAADTLLRIAPALLARHRVEGPAWELPRYVTAAGGGGHVAGALLGLDLALARFALPPALDVPGTPWLDEAERDALAQVIPLAGAGAAAGAASDAAGALARGRARLGALARGEEDPDAVAREAGLTGWRRGALAWAARRRAGAVPEVPGLHETYRLGGGRGLLGWGAMQVLVDGDPRPRVGAPARWSEVEGRRDASRFLSALPDAALVALEAVHARGLPEPLARALFPFVMRWVVDDARPAHGADGPSVPRALRDVEAGRIDDAIAALAAGVLAPVVAEP